MPATRPAGKQARARALANNSRRVSRRASERVKARKALSHSVAWEPCRHAFGQREDTSLPIFPCRRVRVPRLHFHAPLSSQNQDTHIHTQTTLPFPRHSKNTGVCVCVCVPVVVPSNHPSGQHAHAPCTHTHTPVTRPLGSHESNDTTAELCSPVTCMRSKTRTQGAHTPAQH